MVFLGSYAILGDQTSEPNPYIVFVTCLVGAVFSEDIWSWARERFLPKKEAEAKKEEAKQAAEKEAKEKEAKEKEAAAGATIEPDGSNDRQEPDKETAAVARSTITQFQMVALEWRGAVTGHPARWTSLMGRGSSIRCCSTGATSTILRLHAQRGSSTSRSGVRDRNGARLRTIFDLARAGCRRAGARRRRRDARSLLVWRCRAHLARGAGRGRENIGN